jgi:hypothetical protein
MLFSGAYLLNTYSNLDAYIYQCPELICQKPVKFSKDTLKLPSESRNTIGNSLVNRE